MLCVLMFIYAQAQIALDASTHSYGLYHTEDYNSSTCCFLLLRGVTAGNVAISRLTTHA
jgi:hypothetical protein